MPTQEMIDARKELAGEHYWSMTRAVFAVSQTLDTVAIRTIDMQPGRRLFLPTVATTMREAAAAEQAAFEWLYDITAVDAREKLARSVDTGEYDGSDWLALIASCERQPPENIAWNDQQLAAYAEKLAASAESSDRDSAVLAVAEVYVFVKQFKVTIAVLAGLSKGVITELPMTSWSMQKLNQAKMMSSIKDLLFGGR